MTIKSDLKIVNDYSSESLYHNSPKRVSVKAICSVVVFLTLVSLQFSCKKFVEVRGPIDKITPLQVFESDQSATSAVTGIYSAMIGTNINFASGDRNSISIICGLTSDELISYSTPLNEAYNNGWLASSNITNNYLWPSIYQSIYTANSILESLASANGVTASTKNQLEGELKFIRAFGYFYLINLYGDVPLQLTSDYRITSIAPRSSVDKVYDQIITDLTDAKSLLSDSYVTTERVRPNKSAAMALLARVYLYRQKWDLAVQSATEIINNSNQYGLISLDSVFLKNSRESIWQLMPVKSGYNTNEGSIFILTTNPSTVSLSDVFYNSFESGDQRRNKWTGTITASLGTFHYPYKYKVRIGSALTEYSMVFRLAEQYLIRAEAKAQLNDLAGAIADVDRIRDRAGLPLIQNTNPSIDKADLLLAIEKERRTELFTEWGHRWLDLKRLDKANAELGPIKGANWQTTDQLFPIPQDEIMRNPNMTQNPGY